VLLSSGAPDRHHRTGVVFAEFLCTVPSHRQTERASWRNTSVREPTCRSGSPTRRPMRARRLDSSGPDRTGWNGSVGWAAEQASTVQKKKNCQRRHPTDRLSSARSAANLRHRGPAPSGRDQKLFTGPADGGGSGAAWPLRPRAARSALGCGCSCRCRRLRRSAANTTGYRAATVGTATRRPTAAASASAAPTRNAAGAPA
jgi:hypothetical protein